MTRAVLDLLHAGNSRTAVRVDEQHFFSADSAGNQADPNPYYLRPIAFQPPMSARLGIEVSF